MNWLHYLLEANLYLAVFYLGYCTFLSRETYYILNRVYLIFSCVVSFALPVLQLSMLKPIEQKLSIANFTFAARPVTVNDLHNTPQTASHFAWQDALLYAYFLGAGILLTLLLVKLYQLSKLIWVKRNSGSENKYKLIYLDKSTTAFSFFNYLFIGTNVQGTETIIKHELVHIRQKHSVDIMFIELLKIFNWFNPVVYLLQYSIKTLHEYIADEQTAASETNALNYSSFLVNNAYGLDGTLITNSFFNYNLLKKRIIMLNQERSGSLARLKLLLAVPIFGGLLCVSTLAFSKSYGWVDIGPKRTDINNHSPKITQSTPKLLGTQNAKSTVVDKFSYKRADGTVIAFPANTLNNKNMEEMKAKGITNSLIPDVKVDTFKARIAPPVPPAPPFQAVAKRPPPPPPVPPVKVTKTGKGYKFEQDAYAVNGKTDFRVLISLKDGTQKEFYKSKATAADLKVLKDKYGYIFPDMNIYTKMPPPPPVPPVDAKNQMKLPPPTDLVRSTGEEKRLAPLQPAPFFESGAIKSITLIANNEPDNIVLNNVTFSRIRPTGFKAIYPLVIVNGMKYYIIGKLDDKHQFGFSASDSTVAYKNNLNTLQKFGIDAKEGVFYLYGKVELSVTKRDTSVNKYLR